MRREKKEGTISSCDHFYQNFDCVKGLQILTDILRRLLFQPQRKREIFGTLEGLLV